MKKSITMLMALLGSGLTIVVQAQFPHPDGYYTFCANNGANDVSGNGNHGTLNGTTQTLDRYGNTNSARLFDGSSDNVDITGNGFQSTSAYTYSAWIEFINLPSGEKPIIAIDARHKIVVNSSGDIGFVENGNSAVYPFTSGTTSRFYHVAVSNGSGTLEFYVDGVNYGGPYSVSTPTFGSGNDYIGSDGTDYFDGWIDNVRVYNVALTSSEIADVYFGEALVTNVGYYAFDGGSTIDFGPPQNDGTSYNTSSTTDMLGNSTDALSFNGTNSYVDVNNRSIYVGATLSISAWVYLNNLPSTGNFFTIFHAGDNSDYERLVVGDNSTGYGIESAVSGSPYTVYSGSVSPGAWHHVAAVQNNTLLTLYVDGASAGSTATTGVPSFPGIPFSSYIGRRVGGNEWFDGYMDDVRIYNTALTAGQVYFLYDGVINAAPAMGLSNPRVSTRQSALECNPSRSIHITVTGNESATVSVYDISGRKVASSASITTEYTVDGLPAGMYTCRIEQTGKPMQTLKALIIE